MPSDDTLFTSGTLGRYSKTLNSVIENERKQPADEEDQEVAAVGFGFRFVGHGSRCK